MERGRRGDGRGPSVAGTHPTPGCLSSDRATWEGTVRDGDAVGSVSPDPARLLAAARQFGREMEQLRLIQGMSWRQIDEAVQGQPGVSGSESTFYRMVKNPTGMPKPDYVRSFVLTLGLTEQDGNYWLERRSSSSTRRAAATRRTSRPRSRLPRASFHCLAPRNCGPLWRKIRRMVILCGGGSL